MLFTKSKFLVTLVWSFKRSSKNWFKQIKSWIVVEISWDYCGANSLVGQQLWVLKIPKCIRFTFLNINLLRIKLRFAKVILVRYELLKRDWTLKVTIRGAVIKRIQIRNRVWLSCVWSVANWKFYENNPSIWASHIGTFDGVPKIYT